MPDEGMLAPFSDEVADLHAFLPDVPIPRFPTRDELAPQLMSADRYLPCTALFGRALWFLEDGLAFDPAIGALLSRREPDGGCWYELGLERLAVDVRVREGQATREGDRLIREPVVTTQWNIHGPNDVALDSRTLALIVSTRNIVYSFDPVPRTTTAVPAEPPYAPIASVWVGAESGPAIGPDLQLIRAQSTAVGPKDQVWLTWLGDYIERNDRFFSLAVMSQDEDGKREQRITQAHRFGLPFGTFELDARVLVAHRDYNWRVQRKVSASFVPIVVRKPVKGERPRRDKPAVEGSEQLLWPALDPDAPRVASAGALPLRVDDGEYSASAEIRPVRGGGHALVVMLRHGDRAPRALLVRPATADERPHVSLALAPHGALREVAVHVGNSELVSWLCEPELGPPITLTRDTRRLDRAPPWQPPKRDPSAD